MSFFDSDICGRIEEGLNEPSAEMKHHALCPMLDVEDSICLCRELAAIEAAAAQEGA